MNKFASSAKMESTYENTSFEDYFVNIAFLVAMAATSHMGRSRTGFRSEISEKTIFPGLTAMFLCFSCSQPLLCRDSESVP